MKYTDYSDPELTDSTGGQLKILDEISGISARVPRFADKLLMTGIARLKPTGLEVLQINLGNLCNQSCKHCHANAGPDRIEIMDKATLGYCLNAIKNHGIPVVDITGGAPEMNPDFRWFIREIRKLGSKIIIRSNLTIFFEGTFYKDLPDFYAENCLEVVASLPFYAAGRTDSMRGNGVFKKSVEGLRLLNEKGYGHKNTGLILNLVYNPAGAFLSASQKMLENEYKKELAQKYGIEFNNLFTINNMPVGRFLDYLLQTNNFVAYIGHLVNSFNPVAAAHVMCLNIVSVGWNGYLYDCDFNQMLNLRIEGNDKNHISNFDTEFLLNRDIKVSQHCYGCTAGAGSSCGGTLI